MQGSITRLWEIAGSDFGWKNKISEYRKTVPAKKKLVKEREISKEEAETILIVATLIATVTFTAGFTMPGGYVSEGSDKGMATLAGQAAFQIFVISNTYAMTLSTWAVFSLLMVPGRMDMHEGHKYYDSARYLVCLAMMGMVVAFTAATCGVLTHSLGLLIFIAYMGGVSSLFIYWIGIMMRPLGFFMTQWLSK